MLNVHPQICCAPESLFILHCRQKYGSIRSFSEAQLEMFVHDAWMELRIPMWWNLDRDKLLADLKKHTTGKSFTEVCREVYAHYAQVSGKADAVLLGDKNPTYTLFIPQLARLFPQARFLVLVRDHRDNILSYRQVGFDLQSIPALAARWKHYHHAVLKSKAMIGDRLHIVKYESLIAEPDATVAAVCRFLGVDYQPRMLEFYRDTKQALTWNEKTRSPADPSNAGKWKTKFTEAQRMKADCVCGSLALKLGYEIPETQFPWTTRLAVIPGKIRALTATVLEKFFFRVPMRLRMQILNRYRKQSGTLEEMSD
jgi:hypothetical protein